MSKSNAVPIQSASESEVPMPDKKPPQSTLTVILDPQIASPSLVIQPVGDPPGHEHGGGAGPHRGGDGDGSSRNR